MKTLETRATWRRSLAWLALLGSVFYSSYGLSNYWASQKIDVPSFVFDWERHTPFLAWTIFPYWSLNLFYALSLFVVRTQHELKRHVLRLLSAQFISVTCFVLFPLQYSFTAPEVSGAPALLFNALRDFDKPFNQAPSLHISLAIIMWDLYRRLVRSPYLRAFVHIWTALICVSVLTTYQHHFIDVPTGALVGVLCVWLWRLEQTKSMFQSWHRTQEPKRITLGLRYALAALVSALLACWFKGAGLWLLWPSVSLGLVALNYLALDVHGFQINHLGQMKWAAQVLFAPYLLAARLNQFLWTRRLRLSHPILTRVSVGRLPTYQQWRSLNRPTLVSVAAEMAIPKHCTPAHCSPCLDLICPSLPQIQQAASYIDKSLLADTRNVHVCCALGFSRSIITVLYWLVSRQHMKDVPTALALIEANVSKVVLSEQQLATLHFYLSQSDD